MKTASTCFGCKKCPYCGIELKKTLVIDSSENDCDVDVFDETNNKEQITFKLEKAVNGYLIKSTKRFNRNKKYAISNLDFRINHENSDFSYWIWSFGKRYLSGRLDVGFGP
ncbi:unnamed protein product [Rhizophagus irregularis]|nr:unnamed protein product [Rhizophagus irregularis]